MTNDDSDCGVPDLTEPLPDGKEPREQTENPEKHKAEFMDIDEDRARLIVDQLLEDGTVSMPSDEPRLTHEPTGAVFDSIVNLAHFHWGWTISSNDNCSEVAA